MVGTGDAAERSVLFFITGLARGGAETQLVHLATHLKRRGWRVHVVSLMPILAFGPVLEDASVEVTSLEIPRGRYDPRALPRLVRVLRRRRPAILCTFMLHANVLGRVAARLAGAPIVVSSLRNTRFGGAWTDRALRWTDRWCTVTTTNSRLAAEALLRRGVVREGGLRVIPNGIDVEAIDSLPDERACYRTELGLAAETFWWLAVGRLEPQKAHGAALRAVAKLRQRGHRLHLAIAGEGAQREALEEEAEVLGLRDHVTFLGVREDVPRLMKAADGLVLASRWEGLPNVVMEALAARTPVVATRVGGASELVEDGVSGVLVEAGDDEGLAEGMARIMRLRGEERSAMVEAGHRHVAGVYGLEVGMQQWEALFDELLARPVRARAGGAR